MWEERTLKVDCGSSNVAMDLELGDRVALRSLVGNVRFIGETHFAAGIWIGIELEEPVGKNDGSVDGIRYFLPKNATGKGLFGIFSRRDGIHKVSQGYTPPSTAGGEQRTASNAESRASDPSRLKKIIAKLEDKLYAMNEKCKASFRTGSRHQIAGKYQARKAGDSAGKDHLGPRYDRATERVVDEPVGRADKFTGETIGRAECLQRGDNAQKKGGRGHSRDRP